MTDLFVPKEHRKLYCPYCNAEQNDMNIIKTMYSDPNWVVHTCESCGKMFAYVRIVERMYITSQLKEEA